MGSKFRLGGGRWSQANSLTKNFALWDLGLEENIYGVLSYLLYL